MGGRCEEFFSKSHTYLLCMNASGEKYNKSLEWGIKAVKADWILECAKEVSLCCFLERYCPIKRSIFNLKNFLVLLSFNMFVVLLISTDYIN